MAKNRKKSSYLIGEISNPNTGEIISSYNKKIEEKVQIKTNYIKFHPRFIEGNINYKYEGYFNHIIELLLQYETNEIRFKGKPKLNLNYHHFAQMLEVSTKTIGKMMEYFSERQYIKKVDGKYFINPRICLKGKKVYIETVLLFIDDDKSLKQYLDTRSKNDIRIHKKCLL